MDFNDEVFEYVACFRSPLLAESPGFDVILGRDTNKVQNRCHSLVIWQNEMHRYLCKNAYKDLMASLKYGNTKPSNVDVLLWYLGIYKSRA